MRHPVDSDSSSQQLQVKLDRSEKELIVAFPSYCLITGWLALPGLEYTVCSELFDKTLACSVTEQLFQQRK